MSPSAGDLPVCADAPAVGDPMAVLARCRSIGARLNAVITVLDKPQPHDRAGPLSSVSVAVKDNIDIRGVPTSNGSDVAVFVPDASATIVQRLQAAGAHLACKTNMLEYAIGNPSRAYGGSRNPHDRSRTSGGSSGGSAALVGAGVLDFAIGTDTSGSVLVPASYCGVIGLKPTHGLIPMDGVTPLAPTCDHVGTLTATADQAASLLGVLADEDVWARRVDGVRVGLLVDHMSDGALSPAVRGQLDRQLTVLAALPVSVREISIPELALVEEALTAIVLYEAYQHHHPLLAQSGIADGTRAFLEHAAACDEARYRDGLAARRQVRAALDSAFHDVDVLLGPTVFRTAPADDALYTTPEGDLESRFTGAYSVSGYPAVSVPCGQNSDGLPVGLLIGGPAFSEATLLSFSAAHADAQQDEGGR